MNLIKELNELCVHDDEEVTTDLVNLTENCSLIMEADEKKVAHTASSFLTHFADSVKQNTLGNISSAAVKNKFGVFAVLHLILHAAKPQTLEKPSIKKYLHNDPDLTSGESSEAEKTILHALSKLHHGEMTGPKCKQHYIEMYSDDPSKFHKEIMALKRKYSKIVKYTEKE